MATDKTVVHIGENSPERIAFLLFHEVVNAEGMERADRAYILNTYVDCINAVKGIRLTPR
jgi:hypothetical protein